MGCDIHPVLERRVKFKDGTEKWVGIHSFNTPYRFSEKLQENKTYVVHAEGWEFSCRPEFDARHYGRFADLAGVCGKGPEAKGLPDDASDLAKFLAEERDSDGHSHSWCSIREALEICLKNVGADAANVHLADGDARKSMPLIYYFGLDIYRDDDSIDNYRVVFWFDN